MRKNYSEFINIAYVGVMLSPMVIVFGEFMRIASFYLVTIMILVPKAIELVRIVRIRKFRSLLVLTVFFMYFMLSIAPHSNILNYKTFTEDVSPSEIIYVK